MKKLLPILLPVLLLLPTSCIRDDMDYCPGTMSFYLSYVYGGTNRYFETVKSDTYIDFYSNGSKYRELTVPTGTLSPNVPLQLPKTLSDVGDIEVVSWTHDPALDYATSADTPLGTGYVRLKELTPGSGICRPVDDLLYGHTTFPAGDRFASANRVIPYVRAICRVRVTLIPQTVQSRAGKGGIPLVPDANDYTFHILGTNNQIDENNVTGGEKIILQPEAAFEESTTNVRTNWFGAFSSLGDYLQVKVYIRDQQVASFNCAPIQIASKPGNYVDLVIDGHYVNPQLQITVNGWRIATVESDMDETDLPEYDPTK